MNSFKLFLVIFALCGVGICEDKPTPRVLAIDSEVIVESVVGGLMMDPLRCDSKGNIFLRLYEDRNKKIPVQRINYKGQKATTIALDIGDSATVADFSVDIDGSVQQFGWDKKELYVFKFSKDGALQKKIHLEGYFVPSHFAVFPSGEYLISGRKYVKNQNNDETVARPFTEIFDADGKPKGEVELQDDTAIQKAVEQGDSRYVNPVYRETNRAIDLGAAIPATDGNIYVLRWTSPAWIYAISRSGKVVRRLEVAAPEDDMMPSGIQMSGGSIAILFRRESDKRQFLKVVDSSTGEETSLIDASDFGSAFACMTDNPRRFTFLSTKKGKLVLRHAQ